MRWPRRGRDRPCSPPTASAPTSALSATVLARRRRPVVSWGGQAMRAIGAVAQAPTSPGDGADACASIKPTQCTCGSGAIRHASEAALRSHQRRAAASRPGIGEAPVLRQATLSLWDSTDRDERVRTRGRAPEARSRPRGREGYFSEWMFVRFVPRARCRARWQGQTFELTRPTAVARRMTEHCGSPSSGPASVGLVSALLLAARGLDVTLLEAADGPGGKMRPLQRGRGHRHRRRAYGLHDALGVR